MTQNLQMATIVLGRQISALAARLALIRWKIQGITTEKEFLQEAVENVARALRVPLCKVLELETERPWLLVRAGFGLEAAVIGNDRVTTRTTSHAGLALRLGSPVICTDLSFEPQFSEAALLRRLGAVSGIATRIGSAEEPFGVLTVHSTVRREFSDVEVQFLNMAAFAIAQGIFHRRRGQSLRSQHVLNEGEFGFLEHR